MSRGLSKGLLSGSFRLIFISLMTKDVEHFFKCFSAIQDQVSIGVWKAVEKEEKRWPGPQVVLCPIF